MNSKTIELTQTIKVQPNQRARQILHIYTKGNHNTYTNNEDILMLMDMHIKQSQFGNHPEATPYWQKVRNEARKLLLNNFN